MTHLPLGPPVRVAQWVNPNPSHTWARSAHSPLSLFLAQNPNPLSLSHAAVAAAFAEIFRPPPAIPAGEIGTNRAAVRWCIDWSAPIRFPSPLPFFPNTSATWPCDLRRPRRRRCSWWRGAAVCLAVMMLGLMRLATPGLAAAWRCHGWLVPPCRHGRALLRLIW